MVATASWPHKPWPQGSPCHPEGQQVFRASARSHPSDRGREQIADLVEQLAAPHVAVQIWHALRDRGAERAVVGPLQHDNGINEP